MSYPSRFACALVSILAAALVALAPPEQAQAAPARTDNNTNAVYFVHGFTTAAAHNCQEAWGPAMAGLAARGWRGPLRSWGYYAGNTGCTSNYPGGVGTPISEAGRQLAWHLYDQHTSRGEKVDVVAHSMGGLVVRAALHGVSTRASGFPDRLYVEDVVTLSTPHQGTHWAYGCVVYRQCRDMLPGSAFLRSLGQGPQSSIGTDWTLIGADDDDTVTTGSATGMTANVGHRIEYAAPQALEHNVILRTDGGSGWQQRVWHHYARTYVTVRAASPVGRVVEAATFWSEA